MLCYGTRIIYRSPQGGMYEFTIIHNIPAKPFNLEDLKRDEKTKRVTFYEEETIHIIPSKYEEDRSIGFEIPRGLISKCSHSQTTITNLLNNALTNRICPPKKPCKDDVDDVDDDDDETETSLKITTASPDKGWWEDCSPIELLNDISSGKMNITTLASKIDSLIVSTLDFNRRSSIKLQYNDYLIDIREAHRIEF
jgi:hypothetical protein